MKQSARIFTTAAALIAFSMVSFAAGTVKAEAGQFKLFGQKIEMAYAPQNAPLDDRFDQFESEEELHELNDAWLGMPAYSSDGKQIGFVEDAYLDDEGYVSELLVSIKGKRFAVYVDGKYAELTDTQVGIDLPATAIAGLERENGFQVVQR
jgi:sporulation protein YlmC with PRC-barrel domain